MSGLTILYCMPGASVTDLAIFSGGNCRISGFAEDVDVYNGGSLTTIVNAATTSATVHSGGTLYVPVGGVATDPTVLNGGTLTVSAGGSALDVVAEPDAVITGEVTYAQPIAGSQGVFTSSGTTLVASAMVVSGAVVGTDADATIMKVLSRGRAIDGEVSGGSMYVSNGGVAERMVVDGGGGLMIVSSGGVAKSTVVSRGYLYASSGLFVDTIVSSAGNMDVRAGGIASNTTVSAGGTMRVSSGGYAENVTSMTGANVVVLDGGTIYPPLN